MIDGGQGAVGATDLSAGITQALKGLRRGDFMHKVAINVEYDADEEKRDRWSAIILPARMRVVPLHSILHLRSIRMFVCLVAVKDLFVQRSRFCGRHRWPKDLFTFEQTRMREARQRGWSLEQRLPTDDRCPPPQEKGPSNRAKAESSFLPLATGAAPSLFCRRWPVIRAVGLIIRLV